MAEGALVIWEFIGGPADGSKSAFKDKGTPPPPDVDYRQRYGNPDCPKHLYVFVDEVITAEGNKWRRYRHAGLAADAPTA
jgi:hypothetical protein